ncbi:MAG: magnetosome protein MamD [Alphaproteobacteria bacterium]
MPVESQLILLKLEGTRFAAQIPFLTGKTFTILKASTAAVGGAGRWLFLQPVGGGGSAAGEIVALKVADGPAQLSWLVGKNFTVGQAPMVAGGNASKLIVLHPASGLAGKGALGATVAAKGKCFGATIKNVALQTAGKGTTAGTAAVTAGKTLKGAAVVKGATSAGTIWSGTGMSLGLGLGLGGAGPVILGGLVAASVTGYAYYRYKKRHGERPWYEKDEFMEVFS